MSVEKTACLRNQLRASLGSDNYGSLTAVSAAGDVGLEIETWSELPQGSGLGGSSILGAAVLAALWRVVGRRASHDDIIHAVRSDFIRHLIHNSMTAIHTSPLVTRKPVSSLCICDGFGQMHYVSLITNELE